MAKCLVLLDFMEQINMIIDDLSSHNHEIMGSENAYLKSVRDLPRLYHTTTSYHNWFD